MKQMTRGSGLRLCLLTTIAVAAVPSVALAQAQPPAEPAPAPAPAPAAEPPPAAGAPAAAAAPAAPEKKWYDLINAGAFVDSYYSQNWNAPRSNANANFGHPFSNNTGFNVPWVGLDLGVDPDPVGASLQLRFGSGQQVLGASDAAAGLGNVQNGYVSWKPTGKDGHLTLMMGKFDSIMGAEVPQSHLNFNYTRGYLYNLAQPFFHTGFRADYLASEMVSFKLLVVNGWNNSLDNNQGKSIGAQVTLTPVDVATISLGYMGGPEENHISPASATSPGGVNVGAESRMRHIVDLVADLKATKDLHIVVNGDYVTQAVAGVASPTPGPADTTQSWYGAVLLARYAFTDVFAGAIRGEYVKDKDGALTGLFDRTKTKPEGPGFMTGTLTLEAAPHKAILIRLDNRMDAADLEAFTTLNGHSKSQFTTTLGVVAHTN